MAGPAFARLPPEERLLCLAARLDRDAVDPRATALLEGQIDWERFWQLAHRHEVTPMTWAWFRSDAARMAGMPEGVAHRAERTYFATKIRNRDRTEELARVLAAFTSSHSSVRA